MYVPKKTKQNWCREKKKRQVLKKKRKKRNERRSTNWDKIMVIERHTGWRKAMWCPPRRRRWEPISEPETTVMFHTVTARKIHWFISIKCECDREWVHRSQGERKKHLVSCNTWGGWWWWTPLFLVLYTAFQVCSHRKDMGCSKEDKYQNRNLN